MKTCFNCVHLKPINSYRCDKRKRPITMQYGGEQAETCTHFKFSDEKLEIVIFKDKAWVRFSEYQKLKKEIERLRRSE